MFQCSGMTRIAESHEMIGFRDGVDMQRLSTEMMGKREVDQPCDILYTGRQLKIREDNTRCRE